MWLSAAIGLAVGIGYYEGAIISTIICIITLVSLKGLSDFINKRVTRSYILTFNLSNFNEQAFFYFTQSEGVEVRELNVIDEDFDDLSMIDCTLSFEKNYNSSLFFKSLKSDYNLKNFVSKDG